MKKIIILVFTILTGLTSVQAQADGFTMVDIYAWVRGDHNANPQTPTPTTMRLIRPSKWQDHLSVLTIDNSGNFVRKFDDGSTDSGNATKSGMVVKMFPASIAGQSGDCSFLVMNYGTDEKMEWRDCNGAEHFYYRKKALLPRNFSGTNWSQTGRSFHFSDETNFVMKKGAQSFSGTYSLGGGNLVLNYDAASASSLGVSGPQTYEVTKFNFQFLDLRIDGTVNNFERIP